MVTSPGLPYLSKDLLNKYNTPSSCLARICLKYSLPLVIELIDEINDELLFLMAS